MHQEAVTSPYSLLKLGLMSWDATLLSQKPCLRTSSCWHPRPCKLAPTHEFIQPKLLRTVHCCWKKHPPSRRPSSCPQDLEISRKLHLLSSSWNPALKTQPKWPPRAAVRSSSRAKGPTRRTAIAWLCRSTWERTSTFSFHTGRSMLNKQVSCAFYEHTNMCSPLVHFKGLSIFK